MASLPSAVLFPFGTLITNIPHLLSRMLQFRLCGIGLPPFSRNLATCRAMWGALGNLRLALSIGNKDRRWARGETSCFTVRPGMFQSCRVGPLPLSQEGAGIVQWVLVALFLPSPGEPS